MILDTYVIICKKNRHQLQIMWKYSRGSYNRGPASFGWDQAFWDRRYMSARGLANEKRGGMMCKVPCTKVTILTDPSYLEKSK